MINIVIKKTEGTHHVSFFFFLFFEYNFFACCTRVINSFWSRSLLLDAFSAMLEISSHPIFFTNDEARNREPNIATAEENW